MILYEPVPWYSALMWIVVIISLILVNELARRHKVFALLLFFVMPLFLSTLVWRVTLTEYPVMDNWFHWVKVYSSLIACLGFLAIRFSKRLSTNKYALMFPAIILVLNIIIAIAREWEVYHVNGTTVTGSWSVMNIAAGFINIITISGWMGIYVSCKKHRDILWPDLMWFWIIAYSLWNFAFVYNCISDHSFYSGAAVLMAALLPAFFIEKGAWIQHRAQTLAIWMLFVLTFPVFIEDSIFVVHSTHSQEAFWFVSSVSLVANIMVLIYHGYRIIRLKRNPLKVEVYNVTK